MDPRFVAIILAAVVLAGLAILWTIARNQRTAELRTRFGAEYEEYDRTARVIGTRRAENLSIVREPMDRESSVETFPAGSLAAEQRQNYTTEWRAIQSRFVDDPQSAVEQAARAVSQLMDARGYPVTDFERRVADNAVARANSLGARQIDSRYAQAQPTTEDLRTMVLYYRSLYYGSGFDELLDTTAAGREDKEVA